MAAKHGPCLDFDRRRKSLVGNWTRWVAFPFDPQVQDDPIRRTPRTLQSTLIGGSDTPRRGEIRGHGPCIRGPFMMTLEASEQYAPESDPRFGSLSAAPAHHRAHHATHARSQCFVELDFDGHALDPDLRRPGEGERALMRAVLTDAIKCLGGAGRDGQLLKADARRWLASRDLLWPFSFENICAVLDLDAPTLRRRLGIQPQPAPPRVNGTAAVHPLANRATVRGRSADDEEISPPSNTHRPAGARSARSTDEEASPGLEAVTAREREIIRQVAFGLRNAEVATKLDISRRTVTTHLANILRKLGIHQRGELLGFALRTAIV